jgi:predicted kinase
MKLLMLKGLPASGKSTDAKRLVDLGNWKRVNKDDLRAMIDNSKWSKKNEQFIVRSRNVLIGVYLGSGYNVVVDDTNFHPSHREDLEKIADTVGAQFCEKFFDTPVEECIKRDLLRPASVGEKVIRGMYNQYLKPKPETIDYVPGLPAAIICDIDGTLAHMEGRSPYDWKKVGEDRVDMKIAALLDRLADSHKIIIVSGRDSVCRPETEAWLKHWEIPYEMLLMRREKDNRKDDLVKREIFDMYIRNEYNVEFVLDDRNKVVEMWRQMGLKCLQVADGDF